MTTYLLESSLSLLLTFGFYKLVLEKERLSSFKRFYLLGSLLVSALVPLLAIEVAPSIPPLSLPAAHTPYVLTPEPVVTPPLTAGPDMTMLVAREKEPDYENYGLLLSGFVTLVLLIRFSVNVLRLARQVATCPQQSFRGATLVLLPGRGLPYTFLHYLFISAAAFQRGEIEEELFTHELAHIRQRHSLDVLLIELLLCLGWFNPVLYGMKRAMQLNHEFLADEAVNQCHHDTLRYQHLLVSKAADTSLTALTSALTFQTTKQRLLMMTKHTSRVKQWISLGSATLLFAALVAALGTTTAAQTTPTVDPSLLVARQQQTDVTVASSSLKTEVERLLQQYGDMPVYEKDNMKSAFTSHPGKAHRNYSSLSKEEKKRIMISRITHMPLRTPTETQWAAWKKNKTWFGIWLYDHRSQMQNRGKRLQGQALNAYKRTDIAYFMKSYNREKTRHPEQYTYRIDLFTHQARQEELAIPLDTLPKLLLLQQNDADPHLPAARQQLKEKLATRPSPLSEPEKLVGDKLVKLADGKRKKYSELSDIEKQWVFYSPLPPRRTPTEKQWTAWHNPKMYGVWVDGKRLRGAALNAYKRTDIVEFSGSYVHKNARQPEGYKYQMNLTTEQNYQKMVEEHEESPFIVVMPLKVVQQNATSRTNRSR